MKTKRQPTHPGIILKELYLDELGISIAEFARHISVSRKTMSMIVNGHNSVTPEMAIKLSMAFTNSSPESWINLQRNYDLWLAEQNIQQQHTHITPILASA